MVRLLLVSFFLLLLPACGSEPAPVAESGGPALWRVQRQGFDGYLFGTIHVLPKGVAWQSAAMRDAMKQADRLVLETDSLDDEARTMAAFQKLGQSANLPPLVERVPEGDQVALEKVAREGGTSVEALSGYESWAAAMLLSAAIQQQMDVAQENGVEPALTKAFRDAGKPLEGLETVEAQFGAFDALPEAVQRRFLAQTVREAGDLKALYARILAAWLKGDVAAIAREDRQGEQPEPLLEEAVLVSRNRNWAAKIAGMKGRPFIAVGAGHLTGRENLVGLLTARGFAVTRVQ